MAGAGYDISASRAESTSQAANQTAGTVINFGGGTGSNNSTKAYTDGGWYGQSATPSSNATAARNAGDSGAGSEAGALPLPGISSKEILTGVAIALISAGIVYLLTHHK